MTKTIHFEKSMTELEALVKALEQGDLSLEDALKHFEQGIGVARQCQAVLTEAEQKIQQLITVDKTTTPGSNNA